MISEVPWSKGEAGKKSPAPFEDGDEVVPLCWLDGEYFDVTSHTLSTEYPLDISMRSGYRKTTEYIQTAWKRVRRKLCTGWSIGLLNLYPKRSIYYKNLLDYVLMCSFSINGNLQDWTRTRKVAHTLGLFFIPTLEPFKWSEEEAKRLCETFGHLYTEIRFRHTKALPEVCRYVPEDITLPDNLLISSVECNDLIWIGNKD